MIRDRPPTRSTFYSPIVRGAAQGEPQDGHDPPSDKSRKYSEGDDRARCSAGARFSARSSTSSRGDRQGRSEDDRRAVPNEIEHDNPEIRHTEELCKFPGPALQPGRHRGGHDHPDPLLGDQAELRRLSARRTTPSNLIRPLNQIRDFELPAALQRAVLTPLSSLAGRCGPPGVRHQCRPAPRRASAALAPRSPGRCAGNTAARAPLARAPSRDLAPTVASSISSSSRKIGPCFLRRGRPTQPSRRRPDRRRRRSPSRGHR